MSSKLKLISAFVLAAHAGLAGAADRYPSKLIRWVVPWPAGGVADTQARIIAEQLGIDLRNASPSA